MASKLRSFLKNENRDFDNILDSVATLTDAQTLSGAVTLTGALTTASVTKGLVSITATDAITAAEHAGRTLVLNAADADSTAVTLTLPAATGTGNVYHFIVGVVSAMTAAYKIQVVGDDTIDGFIIAANDVAAHASNNSLNVWKTVAASDTITLNGTTTGGVAIGDWICLTDIAADQWAVDALLNQSGTEATPFTAAVS
mgnify:CR=1 FL=1|tara:strand:- start:104 stop:700 length:597 start_codon:yes stop_codon:yes gene_type:complete